MSIEWCHVNFIEWCRSNLNAQYSWKRSGPTMTTEKLREREKGEREQVTRTRGNTWSRFVPWSTFFRDPVLPVFSCHAARASELFHFALGFAVGRLSIGKKDIGRVRGKRRTRFVETPNARWLIRETLRHGKTLYDNAVFELPSDAVVKTFYRKNPAHGLSPKDRARTIRTSPAWKK